MKKMANFVLSAILLILVIGCSPGTDIEVNVPSTTIQLTTPGPNPNSTSRMRTTASQVSVWDSGMVLLPP